MTDLKLDALAGLPELEGDDYWHMEEINFMGIVSLKTLKIEIRQNYTTTELDEVVVDVPKSFLNMWRGGQKWVLRDVAKTEHRTLLEPTFLLETETVDKKDWGGSYRNKGWVVVEETSFSYVAVRHLEITTENVRKKVDEMYVSYRKRCESLSEDIERRNQIRKFAGSYPPKKFPSEEAVHG